MIFENFAPSCFYLLVFKIKVSRDVTISKSHNTIFLRYEVHNTIFIAIFKKKKRQIKKSEKILLCDWQPFRAASIARKELLRLNDLVWMT